MIDRSEILEVATDLSLAPEVVEKDYVLGWLLAGIFRNEALASAWTFKGGTCLKKCYFETYRFSEDLDFTIAAKAQMDGSFLKAAFTRVAEALYDEVGLEIPVYRLRFDVYHNKRNGLSCEGRIYYRGPLRRSSDPARVKLDLTVDEVLVLPPVERQVAHPYSDMPEDSMTARCYAYEEVFAEKVRALAERTRPRDLYDVINLFRNGEFRPAAHAVLNVLRSKCAFKRIEVPTFASLAGATDELLGDWQAMLGHQLPMLPPFESYWTALPEFFDWLQGGAPAAELAIAPIAAQETVFRPAVGTLRRQGWAGSSHLEIIRFAASNHLCVDLGYQHSIRRIEPYSLRRTQAGDILLYAVKTDTGESRSYRLDRIENAQATSQVFKPRYAVELTPTETGPIPLAVRRVGASGVPHMQPIRSSTRGSAFQAHGPMFIYQCAVCGRKFERKTTDSTLRPHKTVQGWPCSGRTGWLVETRYQ
jgi:predicted nucleotidyltransferase component of viral defense system